MSRQLFVLIAGLVEDRAGLHYSAEDRDIFTDKVGMRASEAGFSSFLDYYYCLRYDPEGGRELDELIAVLVVNETYFFREVPPLRAVAHEAVRRALSEGRRARIWSAACATGEEPYTLAMLLDEEALLAACSIIATDVSPRCLAIAEEGRYRGRALRALSAEAEARWFHRQGDAVRLKRHIVESVTFSEMNLVHDDTVRSFGPFDAIFCRNVFIYFREETVMRVVDNLTQALAPAGQLVVGASESLLRFGTRLHCRERDGIFSYVRATT